MNKLVYSFLLALSLCACNTKKGETISNFEDSDSDSVVNFKDSIAGIIEEQTVPKSADELFDDFIYGFMSSKKMQRQRIAFPLEVDEYGKTKTIEESEWKIDRLYKNQEFYTVLYDKVNDCSVEKDTSIYHAVVEWIYLNENRVKKYDFNRGKNGEWKLTKIIYERMSKNVNTDFLSFYQKFATDSAFMRAHLETPLEFISVDEETGEDIKGTLTADQWFDLQPEMPNGRISNVIYGQQYKNPNQKILFMRGLANGMMLSFKFKKIGGDWKLVSFVN